MVRKEKVCIRQEKIKFLRMALKKNKIAEKKKFDVSYLMAGITLILLVLVLLSSFYSYSRINKEVERIKGERSYYPFLSNENSTLISMVLPAVDDKGNGVTTILTVEAMPGTGRTLVDIDNLLFWADTQQSIRVARLVAANLTNLDINNYNLVYSIHANATVIGGGSAGAALTVATIAAIRNKTLRSEVMITGTINHDGTIGPVSEILEKAKVSRMMNASLFLVPLLQSRDVVYETRQHCEKFGSTEVCTAEQIPRRLVVSEQAGIQVKEAGSVAEALEYFFKD